MCEGVVLLKVLGITKQRDSCVSFLTPVLYFVSDYSTDRKNPEFSPSPGQNLVSDATFRSVLEMEMGSLGRATADTRSKSLVVVRILHFRMVGCFSPTGQMGE